MTLWQNGENEPILSSSGLNGHQFCNRFQIYLDPFKNYDIGKAVSTHFGKWNRIVFKSEI